MRDNSKTQASDNKPQAPGQNQVGDAKQNEKNQPQQDQQPNKSQPGHENAPAKQPS